MKTIKYIALTLALSLSANASDLFVHFSGYLKKPGTYKISEWSDIRDLEVACGGWTPFSAIKNPEDIRILRFPRREGLNGGSNTNQKESVILMRDLPTKNGKYQFQDGDLIYIPARVVPSR